MQVDKKRIESSFQIYLFYMAFMKELSLYPYFSPNFKITENLGVGNLFFAKFPLVLQRFITPKISL